MVTEPVPQCEHVTVRSHVPYDGKAKCSDCGETVWLHDAWCLVRCPHERTG